MRIQRVNIEDVYPVEDELGNQYLSRDYDLKANQDYVAALAASFGESGEPNEPPVLVEDGGIYRIKAGNSRIEAMRLLGTKSFTAVIDEDDTPQSLVEAAIRTDTKKTYEEVELSRFVQQLFLFADDDYVSEVTGISADAVSKARRVRKRHGEAAEDLTIERMIAVSEFEGDPDAEQEIMNAQEREWRSIHDRLVRERDHREALASAGVLLRSRGVLMAEERPSGLSHLQGIYELSGIRDEYPEGAVFVPSEDQWTLGTVYAPSEAQEDSEAEAKRAERERVEALMGKVEGQRLEWFLDHVGEGLPALESLESSSSPYAWRVQEFMEDHDLVPDPGLPEAILSFETRYDKSPLSFPDRYIEVTDALEACGYEPSEEEMELYGLARDQREEGR